MNRFNSLSSILLLKAFNSSQKKRNDLYFQYKSIQNSQNSITVKDLTLLFLNAGISMTSEECLSHFKKLNKTETDSVSFSEVEDLENKLQMSSPLNVEKETEEFEQFEDSINLNMILSNENQKHHLKELDNKNEHLSTYGGVDRIDNRKTESSTGSFFSKIANAYERCKLILSY